jgi:hypothetical protein
LVVAEVEALEPSLIIQAIGGGPCE